jgi:uncharacterized protein
MRNPASSFPADGGGLRTAKPWYREPWPWLLAAGPFLVVVASLASAWIAVASDDGLVAEDYYKRGLLINQELKRTAASEERNLGATITVASDGAVRVHMQGLPLGPADVPATLRLNLAHPTRAADDQMLTLTRTAGGDYVGTLSEQTAGRWIVILESDAWRLPTTTISGRLSEVRLGAAASRL